MAKKKTKVRKNFLFPADLAEWATKFAAQQNTSLTKILVDHLTTLRQQSEAGHVEQI